MKREWRKPDKIKLHLNINQTLQERSLLLINRILKNTTCFNNKSSRVLKNNTKSAVNITSNFDPNKTSFVSISKNDNNRKFNVKVIPYSMSIFDRS